MVFGQGLIARQQHTHEIQNNVGWLKNGGNPIIPQGAPGQWDEYSVYSGVPWEEDGTIYLFYGGGEVSVFPRVEISVGLATSTDGGDTFTKQGLVIDRADIGLGGEEEGFSPFCVKKVGSTYYMFGMVYEQPGDQWKVGMVESTDLLNWSNLQSIITTYAINHCPHVIDDPNDPNRWIMYFAYAVESTDNLAIRRATAKKTSPAVWTVGAPCVTSSGKNVLYPFARAVDGYFELLFAKGVSGSTYSIYKTVSRDGLTFPDSDMPVLSYSASGWDAAYVAMARVHDGRLYYSAREAVDSDHYGGIGQAALGNVGGLNEWGYGTGTIAATTDHPRAGNTHGVKLTGGATSPMIAALAKGRDHTYSVWLYDDMITTANFLNTFRLITSAGDTTVAVGLWMSQSTTHYVYRVAGGGWTTTGIARSSGWHLLTFEVGSDVLIRIDGLPVATDGVFDVDTLHAVGVFGLSAGAGYVDALSMVAR